MTSLASLLVVVLGAGAVLRACPPGARDVVVSRRSELRTIATPREGLVGEVGEPHVLGLTDVADEDEDEDDDASAAADARHARRQYRRVLARELGALDERLAELEGELEEASDDAKPTTRRHMEEARAWRRSLERDLEALGRVTPGRWRALKRRIARDLGEGRPAHAFPAWRENTYGM